MTLLIGSLQLGLLYGIMVLGIYISFRILNIPDLTAEGSFTFGLSAAAVCSTAGHPFLAAALAVCAGASAGFVTGIFQTKLQIHPVLAGILTMSGLYSINMAVLGGTPNRTLIGKETLFSLAAEALPMLEKEAVRLILAALITVLVTILLAFFFQTQLGLCIRATGDNADMVKASSINVNATRCIALAISNGLIGLCGGLIAQYQSFADINSGSGILVVGLASVIIGETFLGKRNVTVGLCSAVFGSVIYRYIIAAATKADWFPAYLLKLVSAVIVALALAIPAINSWMETRKLRGGTR